MLFNSSLFANGHYNFIYPPPCVCPMLCGVNTPVLPLALGNPPRFDPLRWEDLGSISVCWWVTTASVSVSPMNCPCLSRCLSGVRGSLECLHPSAAPKDEADRHCLQCFRPQPPDTCQFLTSSALQSLKHRTTCIYLSFHFHRLCVPYTHHWRWLMSFTVWFHRNCLRQKAQCISLNKSSVININARCPRCTLSLDLSS